MPKKFVLFDFDGVIADSFRLAFEIQKRICPHLSEGEYRRRFEGNINDWEDPVDVHTSECSSDSDVDFYAEYIPRMKNEVRIVPGMKEVIVELEKDYTLVVISSTITSPIQEFLGSHDLASHFAWIMGNDVHQSKVEKIRMVFSKFGIAAKECIFITDTLGDMREAEKMGVGSVGVTWGFHGPDTLAQGNPFRLVETPIQLLPAVRNYFLKQ